MTEPLAPRYLPTLTEIVQPGLAVVAPPAGVPADAQRLVTQWVEQMRPAFEAELRQLAQAAFDAQFAAMLPALHQQLEAALRQSLTQPPQSDGQLP